jgi:hypothetical protein
MTEVFNGVLLVALAAKKCNDREVKIAAMLLCSDVAKSFPRVSISNVTEDILDIIKEIGLELAEQVTDF